MSNLGAKQVNYMSQLPIMGLTPIMADTPKVKNETKMRIGYIFSVYLTSIDLSFFGFCRTCVSCFLVIVIEIGTCLLRINNDERVKIFSHLKTSSYY